MLSWTASFFNRHIKKTGTCGELLFDSAPSKHTHISDVCCTVVKAFALLGCCRGYTHSWLRHPTRIFMDYLILKNGINMFSWTISNIPDKQKPHSHPKLMICYFNNGSEWMLQVSSLHNPSSYSRGCGFKSRPTDSLIFWGSPQPVKANARTVLQMRPYALPSICFPLHDSLIIL